MTTVAIVYAVAMTAIAIGERNARKEMESYRENDKKDVEFYKKIADQLREQLEIELENKKK